MIDSEWTATLADLDEPPEGIETIRQGDRIEILDEGEIRGLVVVEAIWTRGAIREAVR